MGVWTLRKFLKVGLALGCLLILFGCSEESLRGKIKELEKVVEEKDAEIAYMKERLGGLQITEQTPQTSLYTLEGASVPTFQTIEDKIVFPNRLMLPASSDDANNSFIQLGSTFKFMPSNNWVVRMQGTTMEVSHPSKISGSLRAVKIKDLVPEESMQDLLKGFFNNFPATNIQYRKVFLADRLAGLIAFANIEIDGKPNVVNVGFVQRGDFAVIKLFVFEDDETGVQQELIDLLISSGRYGDNYITLE